MAWTGSAVGGDRLRKQSDKRNELLTELVMYVRVRASPNRGDRKMKWVTRERPKIDRIACPWLIARFIDPEAEFLYVPADQVMRIAAGQGAIPYDVPGVELGHVGELCSFDAILKRYQLTEPALQRLAAIVRGADTGRPELTPQSPGLLAISLGLARNFTDDHELLRQGLVIYDALYSWCRTDSGARHG
jgi:hypothetical protein